MTLISFEEEDIDVIIDKPESKHNFIDLFCGIGGFHQSLTKIGYKCVFACDIDEKCRSTYKKNYGIEPEKDICDINISSIKPFEVLCAGFPCQSFSKSGFQKGFDDPRGKLFFEICKIVNYHNPKYLLLENVRNLESHDNGNTWNVIKSKIDELGYYTYDTPLILNVLHFNIPQNRERVIIMCKRKDVGFLTPLPNIPKNPKKYLTNTIYNIVEKNEPKNTLTKKMKDVETIWSAFIKLLIEHNISIPKFPIWTDWWDNDLNSNIDFYKKYTSWIDKNRSFYNNNIEVLKPWLLSSRSCENWKGAVRKFEWQAGDLLKNDSMNTVLWTARGSGIRVKRIDYVPTLVAMSMIPVFGPESRKLSVNELLKLQSFPTNFLYDEKAIYKQLGNAVNTKMIEQCAKFLLFNQPIF